jgi:hypothetical protein
MTANDQEKVEWSGIVVAIQPRTVVWRYKIDNRTHYHKGYNIFLNGEVDGTAAPFSVAISEAQQQKLEFRIGDAAKGTAWTKMYKESDYADYYRAGGLKILCRATQTGTASPPFLIPPPDMATYEWRGARMLSLSSYKSKCFQCAWATMAAVEIEYNWGKTKKYRFESFCYGPKSCKLYKMGKSRAVPYYDEGSSLDDGELDKIISQNRNWED